MGWQNVRELSLSLAESGIPAHVLIKGDPGPRVKAFISPKKNITNYFFPRSIFRILMPFYFAYLAAFRRCRLCVWVQERTARFLRPHSRLFGVTQIRLIEQNERYTLENRAGQVVSVEELIQKCKGYS